MIWKVLGHFTDYEMYLTPAVNDFLISQLCHRKSPKNVLGKGSELGLLTFNDKL